MISVEEASKIIADKMPMWGESSAHLHDLNPATILSPILSDRNYPPFNRVMMDGIAVSFDTYIKGLRKFPIAGVIAAGEAQTTLKNDQHCFEIMTGAALPLGTDLIIPYEHLSLENGVAHVITELSRTQWENIHLVGSDCKKNDVVLEAGSLMNGPHWGIAASMGAVNFKIKKTPKIMIISTGNELVDIGVEPEVHQIRRSNAYALKASLLLNGYEDVTLDHLSDEAQVVADHYLKHSTDFDLMIYSGGVSKGKYDYLPSVWMDLGVTRHFHQVSQRPGKPLWFGQDEKRKTTVVGLPGNPVSSLVCLHRYIIPGRPMYAKLTKEIVFKKDLTFFVPVSLEFAPDGSVLATPKDIKNSGEFTALAGSDGFIELPKDQSVFKVGDVFSYYPWRNI